MARSNFYRIFIRPLRLFAVWLILTSTAIAQGNYYDGIDTSRSSFVTDLHNLIYPHTRITYDNFDETNVANFASRDTINEQRVVTCVYSGLNYVYAPPFKWWGTSGVNSDSGFSRGTYLVPKLDANIKCNGFTSRPNIQINTTSIQQIKSMRIQNYETNHPLGIVANITNFYLQCSLGINALGYTVFEPRNSHKGDAARALLYMAVCYNGVDGYNWTFNYLNTVTLPGFKYPEGPENISTLIQWSQQDPPDAWEIARNEYVYSIQHNRNPFIDHPEWVNIIDFNTLTKIGTVTLAPEPSNQATNLFAGTITDFSISLTWTKAISGIQAPSGYILFVHSDTAIIAPGDGTVYPTDTTSSENIKVINLSSNDSSFTIKILNLRHFIILRFILLTEMVYLVIIKPTELSLSIMDRLPVTFPIIRK